MVFSTESLGIFECYDVWTHQQNWVNHEATISGENFEKNDNDEENVSTNINSENVIEDNNDSESMDQVSITSNDSYKENVIYFFNKIKTAAFGASSSSPTTRSQELGKYQAIPCHHQLEKF